MNLNSPIPSSQNKNKLLERVSNKLATSFAEQMEWEISLAIDHAESKIPPTQYIRSYAKTFVIPSTSTGTSKYLFYWRNEHMFTVKFDMENGFMIARHYTNNTYDSIS